MRPRIDELKALFAELDFRMFLNDLTNLAPAEPLPEGPGRRPRPSWPKSRARSPQPLKSCAGGAGRSVRSAAEPGNPRHPTRGSAPSDEQTAESEEFATAQTTPTPIRSCVRCRSWRLFCAKWRRLKSGVLFRYRNDGIRHFNDRIVGFRSRYVLTRRGIFRSMSPIRPNMRPFIRPLFATTGRSPRSDRTSSST